jgi:hypothetical protein
MHQIETQIKHSLETQKIIMQKYHTVSLTDINIVLGYSWLSENNPHVD